MYGPYNNWLITQDGPVLELVINRPDARNAITFELEHELKLILNQAADDDSVSVVTMRGAGKCFSAGHDLKEVAEGYYKEGKPSGVDPHEIPALRPWWYFPKVLIAGVHEFVGPIAQDLLAHCDFVIAAEGTRFSFEQARMGSGNIFWSPLVFMFPMRVYKKMMLMGGWFTAEQAEKWDFVQRVVKPEDLETSLRAWGHEAANTSHAQMKMGKLNIHRQYELMGLAQMAIVGNAYSGHGGEGNDKEFFRIVLQEGLKKALAFRQTFVTNDEITQV
jgi:enoyl-CoA hydratase